MNILCMYIHNMLYNPNITCYITGICDIACYDEGMLYNMLYTMLCNMIHNVLHNMLRAKNPPSHFPLSGSRSASLQYRFIQQLLVGLALIIGEGHATFRLGLIGGRGGAVGGARSRSAGLDSSGGPVVLGWILGVPGQHLVRNLLHAWPGLAGFVVDFIQLLHGASVPVQEVKPGINHGIKSLHKERHSEEACQTGHHHLVNVWNLRQTWAKQCASCRSQMLHAVPKCYR
jgi:hypothetical protein